MASLGTMLAGSAIGQGAAQFVHQQAQGAFDRQRFDLTQAANNFSQNQMDRTLQEQHIASTPTDGETDEDRLHKTADLAKAGGRADLERKYRAEAMKAGQAQDLRGISSASRAITMGQFDQAAQILNRTKTFKGVHSIGLADDAEQDPRNPTYSVYTPGPPDASGQPTRGPHVHLTQQMLYALQADPSHLYQWTNQAINQGQKNDLLSQGNDIKQQRADQQGAHYDAQDNHWQRQDANAMQKAKASGGAGRLTDKRWLYQWAQDQIGKPEGFKDDNEAMRWAMDPNRQNKDYWQSMKVGTEVAKSGGMFTADDIIKVAGAFKNSPIGSPAAAPAPPAAGPQMHTLGQNPRFREAVYGTDGPQGAGWYQKLNGKTTKVE